MENRNSILNSQSNNSRIKINVKMSEDTESQEGQVESFYSPLRSHSSFLSVDPFPPADAKSPSKAMVAVDKFYTPLSTPTYQESALGNLNFQANLPPPPGLWKEKKGKEKVRSSSMVMFNSSLKEDVTSRKGGPFGGRENREEEQRRPEEADSSTSRRSVRASLGFRVCEVILCLISFSVMAADRTQGWSGDSFDRYKEYRYVVAVTIIGLAHSLFQAYDLTYYLVIGKHVIAHHLRYHFEFSMDQILAYLLISASSSAASRIDDWTSNWGKDEFTEMANASVGMSFLAFIAFALSSLISGYNLCNINYT